MPIFEFSCLSCGKVFQVLHGVTAGESDEVCPKCGSSNCKKLVSKFRKGRSEIQRIDEVTERLDRMGEPESGAEVRRIARDLGAAMDDDRSDSLEEMFENDMSREER